MRVSLLGWTLFELSFDEDIAGLLNVHHCDVFGVPDDHPHLVVLARARSDIPYFELIRLSLVVLSLERVYLKP